MTEKQQREELSKAYVHAVAASCGYKLGEWSQDDDCMDVTICASGVQGGGVIADPKIDLQLKATNDHKRHVQSNGTVAWTLAAIHYEQLRRRAANPKLLVVLVLPEGTADWISHTNDHLILRRCAYWIKMTGQTLTPAPGKDSLTLHLPKEQVFSPENLRSLMEKLSREEEI